MCLKKYKEKRKWNKQKRGWNRINRGLELKFQDEHNSVEQALHEIRKEYKITIVPSLENELIPILNTNYGSGRPDNDCIFMANNIEYKDSRLIIHSKKEKAIGKGYYGEPIVRNFTSGMVRSMNSYEIKEGTRIMAQIKMPISAVGAFTAFWLLRDKKGKSYFESDIYERMAKTIYDEILTFSVHHRESDEKDRKMYSIVQTIRPQGITKLYDVLYKDGWTNYSINNTLIYRTQHGYPIGEHMTIIFNDAIRFWKGDNLFVKEVIDCLPWQMEISNLTIMQKK